MSDSSTPRSAADANLLFGVLALQMDFISSDALIAALHAWIGAKRKPLGDILVERGALSPENRTLLEALVGRHQAMHNNDLETSLAAATASFAVPNDLFSIDDDDLRSSLSAATTHIRNGPRLHNGADLQPERGAGQRYRIVRPFARGGLGEVSIAEDLELHREVALKEILARHANDEPSRSRFLLEAEITGRLEHPGIVPVYGLGVYSDGRPFYAMRLIKGETLKKAIQRFHSPDDSSSDAERSLRFRELLGRFVGVCNAIAYAHSRGILHRDLKPGNIMLGTFGETLVVDWGLSKAVDRPEQFRITDETALRPSSGSGVGATMDGAAIGTPGFMSPEQAEGRLDELSPASDVYSLGATLYAMLTGKTPYVGSSDERRSVQVDPARLMKPRQIRPDTPRALEAICLKAMAVEPGDRYASALDLAREIEHWLADEPVTAWSEPWTVRAGRWGRRHRTALVAAGVFLVSAVAALAISTALIWSEQRRTAEQKLAAEQSYALSRELSANILKIIESSEAEIAAVPALHGPRREILRAAAQTYRQHLARDPDDPELMTSAAQIYRYSGNVHRHANEIATAEPLLAESVALADRLASLNPDSVPARRRLSETLRDYAKLQSNAGRLREAAASLQRAIALGDELYAVNPNEAANLRVLGGALLNLASVEQTLGAASFADTANRALAVMKELAQVPAAEKHPYDPLLLAAAQNAAAVAFRESGRLDDARARHKEALATVQPLEKQPRLGLVPADVLHFRSAILLDQCRTLAASAAPERLDLADKNLGSVIQQWKNLADGYRLVPLYRESRGIALQVRGQLRLGAQRLDDAAADLEESRKSLEELTNEVTVLPATLRELGRTYWLLGRVEQARAQRETAKKWYDLADKTLLQALRQAPDDAPARQALKDAAADQKRLAEAN